MKIAVIFPKDSESFFNKKVDKTFGGASVQMYSFAKSFATFKHVVVYSYILDYPCIDFDDSKHFNLIKMFKKSDMLLIKFLKFYFILNKNRPDVVIQHGLTLFSCILAKMCKVLGIKFVFMFASDIEVSGRYQTNNKRCYLFKSLLMNSFLLITQNQFQKNELFDSFSRVSTIVRNGFELDEGSERMRKYVLWVSRYDDQKRPEYFLKLARQNPDLNFLMICPKTHKTSLELYNIFKKSALEIKNLRFIDYVPFNKINEYFLSAKIFINTSVVEGYPQTFIQSGLNGVPIISLCVDPDGFISQFRCGYVCGGSIEILNKKLIKIIKDPVLYETLSKNIYDYAINNHNIATNAALILQMLSYDE